MIRSLTSLSWGWAIAALLMLATSVLGAQESAPAPGDVIPDRLSVVDAVAVALGENSDLKQAEEDRLSSMSRLRIASINTIFGGGAYAGLKRNPDDSTTSAGLSGDLSYRGLGGTQAQVTLSPFGIGDLRSAVGLTLRTPLMRGKGRLSQKSNLLLGARSDVSVQEKQLYLTRQFTTFGVVNTYYQAVLERERVKVRERGLAIAEEVADGARKRADAGLVAEIEVSRADLRVARTKDELNLQTQTARAAMDRLMLTIGIGVGHDPALTDGVPEAEIETPDLAEAVKTALKNRSELGVSDEQLSEKARELAMAEDRLQPGLDLVGGYDYSELSGGLVSGSLFGQGEATMGVELVLPLDKRIDREQRNTTSRELDVLRRVRTYQMEQIAEQVRRAHRSLEAARASLGILDQNSKVAEDNLKLAQRMVEEGLVSNRETLDAQDSLTSVESGLLSAKTNLYIAYLNLKYAMGEDLTTVVSK
jgi:outer membrane protein TolC